MVFSDTLSPFWRKSRFPLSSTMHIVTFTLRFAASASAPATIALIAATLRYFLVGKSAAVNAMAAAKETAISLNMGNMLSTHSPSLRAARSAAVLVHEETQ